VRVTVHRRRRPFALATVGVALVGAVGVGVMARIGKPTDAAPSAASTLRAAQRAVAREKAFSYEVHGLARVKDATNHDGIGRTVSHRYAGEGAAVRSVSRQVVDGGQGRRETLRAHGTVYRRAVAATPGNEPWDGYEYRSTALARHVDELTAVMDDGGDELALAVELYLGGGEANGDALTDLFAGDTFTGDPAGYRTAIEHLPRPRVTARRDGVVTLTAVVSPDPAFGDSVPDGTIELDVGPDDLPRALRLHVMTDRRDEVTVDVRFTRWGSPASIPLPRLDQVDVTPRVEEAALRARAAEAPVLWPDHEPTDHELDSVEASSDGPCPGVRGAWGSADRVISLTFMAAACVTAADPLPFRAGGVGGFPSRLPGDAEGLQVLVGDTVVEVAGDLPPGDLDAVLRSLRAIDGDRLVRVALDADLRAG